MQYEWSSYKACLPKGCPDCGCSGPHYCVGKKMPDFFGSKIEVDPTLPPDGWYLKPDTDLFLGY